MASSSRSSRSQSLLGDIHDCDVWADQLDAFSEKQAKRLQILYGHPGPLARVKAGIDYLRADRCQRRGELFSMLTQYWRDLTCEGLWDGLIRTVRRRASPVRPRSRGQRRAASDLAGEKRADRPGRVSSVAAADRSGDAAGRRNPDGRPPKTVILADVTTVQCNPARN